MVLANSKKNIKYILDIRWGQTIFLSSKLYPGEITKEMSISHNYFRILVYKCGFIFHKIRVKMGGADYSKKNYLVWKREFCELNHT